MLDSARLKSRALPTRPRGDPAALARRCRALEARLVALRRSQTRAGLHEVLETRGVMRGISVARHALRSARQVAASAGPHTPALDVSVKLSAFAGGAATAHAALEKPALLLTEAERVRADLRLLIDEARRAALSRRLA